MPSLWYGEKKAPGKMEKALLSLRCLNNAVHVRKED
jgi:hypothetical protein